MTKTINNEIAVQLALEVSTEDYIGLYEIIWELNTKFPNASLWEKYRAGSVAVSILVEQGFIQMFEKELDEPDTEFRIIENGETLSLTKEEMQAKFQEHFKEAERLINETGYHRRDEELEELRIKS